jgi:hypothetical protein
MKLMNVLAINRTGMAAMQTAEVGYTYIHIYVCLQMLHKKFYVWKTFCQ